MFTLNENTNLYVDKELFYDIDDITSNLSDDEKHFTVLALFGVLSMTMNTNLPTTFISLDIILATMAQNINFKATAKIRTGIMNGLNRLYDNKLIKLSEPFDGKKGQIVSLDSSLVLHRQDNTFTQISRKELATIMKSSTPHHLITLFHGLASRWNMVAYISFNETGWNKNNYVNNDWKLYKTLSCFPTQEQLKNSWCMDEDGAIQRSEDWNVSRTMFSKYFDELIELGLISRITVQEENKHSYYCRPIHKKCVEEILGELQRQQEYMKQSKQQATEPIEDTEPTEPIEQPKQSKASSRGKNKEWYMD